MCAKEAHPIRILLVDDETAILRSLSRILEVHGFDVSAASGAAEAEVFLQRNEVDVLICDHQMPGRTGLEFLAAIKLEKPDLITMILSGQIDGIDVAQDWAMEIGVDAVFQKPFDAALIAEHISRTVLLRVQAS